MDFKWLVPVRALLGSFLLEQKVIKQKLAHSAMMQIHKWYKITLRNSFSHANTTEEGNLYFPKFPKV